MKIRAKWLFVTLALGLGMVIGVVLTVNTLPGEVQAQMEEPSPMDFAQNNTNWVVETVDSDGGGFAGARTSLAIDSSGTPHIAYHVVTSDSVKYAVLSGTTWLSETVETSAILPSLVVDDSDTPHIAYMHSWWIDYAVLSSTTWITEAVDQPCASAHLALDSSGNPHITYSDIRPPPPNGLGEGFKYAHRTASGWVTESIDVEGGGGDLALDGSDTPHIAYGAADDSLKYTVLSGAAWVSETVEVSATSPSLVLDNSDNPHIAYIHFGSYVSYAVLIGTTWVTETVDEAATRLSLALDSFGNPHIAYCSGEGLKYAYRTVCGWMTECVDGVECSGLELALDGSGSPHISYYDTARHDIKYARLTVPGCSSIVFNDEFDGNELDSDRWDVITGTPVVSGGWLTLSEVDVQSKCAFQCGVLRGVIRSYDWSPHDVLTDSSFGFEVWAGNNGQCHYGVLFKADGHLAVLRSQPDPDGNCSGDPSYQYYSTVSNWDVIRSGNTLTFTLSRCLDSVTLKVGGNDQVGQASYSGQALPSVPLKIRLYAEPAEMYEIDRLRLLRACRSLYLPLVTR